MPTTLQESEIKGHGSALRMSRVEVPDYITDAVAASVKRGKLDAAIVRPPQSLLLRIYYFLRPSAYSFKR
jgi:hypothetical protein